MEDIQVHIQSNIHDIDTMINYCSQNKSSLKKMFNKKFLVTFF